MDNRHYAALVCPSGFCAGFDIGTQYFKVGEDGQPVTVEKLIRVLEYNLLHNPELLRDHGDLIPDRPQFSGMSLGFHGYSSVFTIHLDPLIREVAHRQKAYRLL